MKPLYRYIEFCRKTETLWHKIESGDWDWLGVHKDGQFVLGRPKRSDGSVFRGALSTGRGQHGVLVKSPLDPGPNASWFSTEQEAKEEFSRTVERILGDGADIPILLRVQRVAGQFVEEEEFVVRRPPTYLR
jgi:hypothetical protein